MLGFRFIMYIKVKYKIQRQPVFKNSFCHTILMKTQRHCRGRTVGVNDNTIPMCILCSQKRLGKDSQRRQRKSFKGMQQNNLKL